MNKAKIKKIEKILRAEVERPLFNDRLVREDFGVCADDRYDEVDQATTDNEQNMRMRLRNREALYLKKVKEALVRIEDGVFGLCNECGEDIEGKRLEARPIVTLCIACKEEQERRETLTASGRQHKSMGEAFSRRTA